MEYTDYPIGVRVLVRGKEGDAFERLGDTISVFLDDDDGRVSFYKIEEVEFLNYDYESV